MSSEPPSGGRGSRGRGLALRPSVGHADLLLHGAGQGLVGLAPGGHAHRLDVLLRGLGHHLVEVGRPGDPQHPPADARVRHLGRRLRHGVAQGVEVLDLGVGPLTEVVPDRRLRRHDVGLVSAARDHVVRTMGQGQVLPAEVPGHVHELDGVERAAPRPGRARGMRGPALEGVLHRDEPLPREGSAVVHREIAVHVRAQHHVDVLEQAGAHQVRLGRELFFRDPGIEAQGARELVRIHQLLQHQGRGDVDRLARVVAFAMPGRAFDQGGLIRDPRLLRGLGNAVYVGDEADHRFAGAVARDPGRGHAGHSALDPEAVRSRRPVRYFEVWCSWKPSSA